MTLDKFYTGCSKFDKDYINKELERKGKEAFGVFHHGPESSTLTSKILPYYIKKGITVPVLSNCVAEELTETKNFPTFIRLRPNAYFDGKVAATAAYNLG